MACPDVEIKLALESGNELNGREGRQASKLKDLLRKINRKTSQLPLFSFKITKNTTNTTNPPLPQMTHFQLHSISVSLNFPPGLPLIAVNQNFASAMAEHLKQHVLQNQTELVSKSEPHKDLQDIKQGGHICFIGPAGSGKTTLLRVIARNSIAGNYPYDKIKHVYVIHPGPFEQESETKCLASDAIFSCNVGNPEDKFTGIESEKLYNYAKNHASDFLFIIDSLDTLPQELNNVSDPAEPYRDDREYHPMVHLKMLLQGKLLKGCRIITSSRPHAIRNFQGDLKPSRTVSLLGFTKADALKVLKLYSPDAKRIFEVVDGNPHLFSLFKEPVFLVYLVKIWPDLKGGMENMRATDVLIKVVGCFHNTRQHARGNYEKLKEMQKLARETLWRRQLEFGEACLAKYGLKVTDLTDLCTYAPDKSGNQIILKLINGESLFMFSHQSMQEMFAALDVIESDFGTFMKVTEKIHEPFFLKTRDFVYGLLFGRYGHKDSDFPDMEKKCDVLKKSIESRYRVASPPEQLSIFETLAEAVTEAGQFNLETSQGFILNGIPMNDWSLYCTGIATSQFSMLQVLHLEGCGIQLSHLRALETGIRRFNCQQPPQIFSFSLRNNSNIGKAKGAVSIACKVARACKVDHFDMSFCGLNSDSMSEMLEELRNITIGTLNLEFNAIGKEGVETAGTIVKQCSIKEINISECARTSEEAEAFGKSAKGSRIQRLSVEHRSRNIVSGYGNVIRYCDVATLVILLTTLTPDDASRITKDSCCGKISRIEFTALVQNRPPQRQGIVPPTESNCEAIRILLPTVKKQISMPVGMASSLIENLQSSLDNLQCEEPVITFPTANKVLTLKGKRCQSQKRTDENMVQQTCKVENVHRLSDTSDEGRIRNLMESEYLKLSDGCRTMSWLAKNKEHRMAVLEILSIYGLSMYQYKLKIDDCNLLAEFLSSKEPNRLKSLSFAEVTGLDLLLNALNSTSNSMCQATEVCFIGYSGIDNGLSPNIIAEFIDTFQAESLVLMAIDALCVKELRTSLVAKAKTATSFRKLEIYHNPNMGIEDWSSLADIANDWSETPLHISACFCNVSDDHLSTFKKKLGSTKLAGIDVCGNPQLSDKGFSILGEMIQTSQITSVSLEDCELDVGKIQSLNGVCRANTSPQIIKFLNLADNPSLGPESFAEIKRIVEYYKVESLNLSNSVPDDLPEEFDFEHKFESLDLSENEYCTNLTKLAKTANKKLYLRNCQMSVDELVTLALDLKEQGAKLEEVDVSDDSRELDFDDMSRLKDSFKSITESVTLSSETKICFLSKNGQT